MVEKGSDQHEVDWICVDASLSWEERVTLFPLSPGQQYKFFINNQLQDESETALLEGESISEIPAQEQNS